MYEYRGDCEVSIHDGVVGWFLLEFETTGAGLGVIRNSRARLLDVELAKGRRLARARTVVVRFDDRRVECIANYSRDTGIVALDCGLPVRETNR
jgi:hypothetical protein